MINYYYWKVMPCLFNFMIAEGSVTSTSIGVNLSSVLHMYNAIHEA